jgi:predicted nucleotidyltransferase
MINQERAVKLYKEFSKEILVYEQWYRDISLFIEAILLYGSVAKGVNRSDSDIDILFILPLAIEEKFTVGEYFYQFGTHEINIVVRSIEKMRYIADEQKDTFQKEIFRDAVIIDSNQEVEHLLARIGTIVS